MDQEPSLPLPCVDAIIEMSDSKIRCERRVESREEYFVDHFSNFPVLPGVLQLEGLVQAASWWVRHREGFRHSQVRMTACSQAKFVRLVRPDTRIELEAEFLVVSESKYRFKGQVIEKGEIAATARFELTSRPLADVRQRFADLENDLNSKYRLLFNRLVKSGGPRVTL